MITTTDISTQYSPASATNTFAFNISYFVPADINVDYVDTEGNTTKLWLGSDPGGFTITPVNGDPNNGATIVTSEYYSEGTITIYREVPITQENEFLRGGDLPPEILNNSFDRGVAINQQIQDIVNRSIQLPITDPDGLNYIMPSVLLRANKVVGFDDDGNVIPIDVGGSDGLIGVDTSKGLSAINGIVSTKVDNATVQFDGSGNLAVKTITNTNIANDAVDTDNIATGAVTSEKIADISDYRVLGRVDSGDGAPTEVIVDQDLTAVGGNTLATALAIKTYVDAVDTSFIGFTGHTSEGLTKNSAGTWTYALDEFQGSGLDTGDIRSIIIRLYADVDTDSGTYNTTKFYASYPSNPSTQIEVFRVEGSNIGGSSRIAQTQMLEIPINKGQLSFILQIEELNQTLPDSQLFVYGCKVRV